MDWFRNISGLKINCSKTKGMWIGSLKESKEEYFGIKWPNIPIKALGVYFTYDQKLLRANFSNRQTPSGRGWKIDFSLFSSTYSP